MDIDSMKCFIELGQCSSVTEAARRLNLSQPTLSKRIKVMEKELGCELFERGAQPIRLTPAGSAFLGACVDIVNRYGEVNDEIGWLSRRPVVNVGGMLHDSYVKQFVSSISGERASYALNCKVDSFDALSGSLKSGELDALFAPLDSDSEIFSDKALSPQLLKHERAFAAIGKGSDLFDAKEVAVADFKGLPLIRLAQQHSTDDGWRMIESACLRCGFTPKMRLLEPGDGYFDIGDGIYLLPESKLLDTNFRMRTGEANIVPVGEGISFDLYIVTLKKPSKAVVRDFRKDIENYVAALDKANNLISGVGR